MTTKRRAADDGFSLSTPNASVPAIPGAIASAGERIVPVSTRIPERLHREVKILAASQGVKAEALFVEALTDLLRKYAGRR